MRITTVTPDPGDAVRVFLAPPAFVLVTADAVTLFDGGDAGRVLWRKPERNPPPDPDVIRGIERVTGETYDPETGEWAAPAQKT